VIICLYVGIGIVRVIRTLNTHVAHRHVCVVHVRALLVRGRISGLGGAAAVSLLQITSTRSQLQPVTAVLVFQLVSIYHQYTKQTHRHIVGNLGIISLKHTFFISFSSRLHFLLVIRPRISTLAGLNCCTLLYTFSLQHHGFKIWHDQPHKTQRRGK
jgi:hypothetical protein